MEQAHSRKEGERVSRTNGNSRIARIRSSEAAMQMKNGAYLSVGKIGALAIRKRKDGDRRRMFALVEEEGRETVLR